MAAPSVRAASPADAFVAIRSISQMPDVNYARIRTRSGRLLAETGGGTRLMSDASMGAGDRQLSLWSVLNTGSIQVTAPIVDQGETVGEITIFARTPGLRARVLSAVWTSLAGALVALGAGLLVSVRMARGISGPIVGLARFINGVQQSHDYSKPAEIKADGEVADLVDGFNAMLDGIRARDERIAAHVAGLETEVANRTAELVVARDQAEAANAAKSDFLAVMSHEIRTPMNGILALSDMLAKSELPPRQQRYADVIAKSGKSLLSIINDILDFSKVEAGKMDLESIEVDLAEVAEDVASLFFERATGKGLDLAVFVDPRVPPVMTDPTRLRQVLGNLANNAIKFTDEGGVLIDIGRDPDAPDRLLFAIRDTGPGIPADKLPTLFEAFTQADQTTTRKHGGTGLGLAICDRLVRAMGGEWKLASVVGEGSTFAFSVALDAAGEPQAPLEWAAEGGVAVAGLGPLTTRAVALYLEALGVPQAEPAGAAAVIADPKAAAAAGRMAVAVCEDDSSAALVSQTTCALVRPLRREDLTTALRQIGAGETPSLGARHVDAVSQLTFPGVRVLVVDDSDVNREVACEALARLGVVTFTADDGQQAVERLRTDAFDLVLMDGSMPVLDGFEATLAIRAEEAEEGRERAVIVALTAHVVGSGADAWKRSDMDGVIHKPFTLDDLQRTLMRFHPDRAVSGALLTPVEPSETASEPGTATAPATAPAIDTSLFDADVRGELLAMAANGRGDFVDRVEGLYATNAPLRLADLDLAVEGGDADRIARAAHALKSMSLSLGASAVARQASSIENAARAGESVGMEAAAEARRLVEATLAAMAARTGEAATAEPAEAPAPTESMAQALAKAIANDELHLVYQSLVDRSGQRSPKVEALIRWTHPEKGRLSPDDFIPALEAEGAIPILTDFVLARAMQELKGHSHIRVSINASASEFTDAGFAERVARAAAREGFPLDRLEIEVTETAMISVAEAKRSIDVLRAVGVGVALDDFGAGYTSLHALRELRFTTLKVDRSFVDSCSDDVASAAIIHAVIGVGRALGMKVVCEGVETAAQADFLRVAGCHYMQGYFYHRPCPVAELPALATAA
jgi:signal transduction histidine kinase/EAL domain-containing protein (putative c-di-GMP-specific phosphodiesterase class I)/DNA-binding NarL/FixJ family response regulator